MNIPLSILGPRRRPDITFHSDGRIDITARISRALDISPGDAIDILALDGEYFLCASSHDPAAPLSPRFIAVCRPTKPRSRHFRTWCRPLARAVIDITLPGASAASLAAGDTTIICGQKAIHLITRSPFPHPSP